MDFDVGVGLLEENISAILLRGPEYPITLLKIESGHKFRPSPLNKQINVAVPLLKWLVAGFTPRRLWFAFRQDVGFVVDKAALGQVFSEYLGFPCRTLHQFLHHHNHRGWHNLAH
jgi:hypothetical protein